MGMLLIAKRIPIFIMNYTTWIEINESNLNHNISKYKSWLPATTSIAAVIKANAYGHGLYEIASIHEKNKNISYLCVVNSHEALILRKQGICKPILILSYINSDIATIIANNIDITVYNLHDIILINETAQKLHKKVTIPLILLTHIILSSFLICDQANN